MSSADGRFYYFKVAKLHNYFELPLNRYEKCCHNVCYSKKYDYFCKLMKQTLLYLIALCFLMTACGPSQEEQQRLSQEERLRAWREDSAALKIAVMPTLDCLPLYVAEATGMFQRMGADIRLKYYTAQMDCDTALVRGRVEGMVSDLVRTERLQQLGTPLEYKTSTGSYWQLLTGVMARIRQLKQLDDKMLAMTRYSATHLLAELVVDSAKLDAQRVFFIQLNDVKVRLSMLQTNTMDALLLPEPQATQARLLKARVLIDSRRLDLRLGVIAFSQQALKDTVRQRQAEVFLNAYNMACDTINAHGISHYASLLEQYCGLSVAQVDSLPRDFLFEHASLPRKKDISRAKEWLKKTQK